MLGSEERSTSRLHRLTPTKDRRYFRMVVWLDPSANLDGLENRKISCLYRYSNLGSYMPYYSLYTEHAILTLVSLDTENSRFIYFPVIIEVQRYLFFCFQFGNVKKRKYNIWIDFYLEVLLRSRDRFWSKFCANKKRRERGTRINALFMNLFSAFLIATGWYAKTLPHRAVHNSVQREFVRSSHNVGKTVSLSFLTITLLNIWVENY
jgi:hypothetical protein